LVDVRWLGPIHLSPPSMLPHFDFDFDFDDDDDNDNDNDNGNGHV
jgi:hypothetical protein